MNQRGKMTRRKKVFSCGHKGFGQKCHRCEQVAVAQEIRQTFVAEKQQQKREWLATFEQDSIDLRDLPPKVVVKAREIVVGLQERKDYREFGGKRLRHDRRVISIPVTRDYRLLCLDRGDGVEPKEVMSHEDYNVCKPGSI
jgi:hypothetical protein